MNIEGVRTMRRHNAIGDAGGWRVARGEPGGFNPPRGLYLPLQARTVPHRSLYVYTKLSMLSFQSLPQ